jgi:hypothetical protein
MWGDMVTSTEVGVSSTVANVCGGPGRHHKELPGLESSDFGLKRHVQLALEHYEALVTAVVNVSGA